MSNFNSIRLIPQNSAVLNRKSGQNGEVFFDPGINSLRVYTAHIEGGIPLLRADLANLTGTVSIASGDTPPSNLQNGSVWYNTADATMYVYYYGQWVQPT